MRDNYKNNLRCKQTMQYADIFRGDWHILRVQTTNCNDLNLFHVVIESVTTTSMYNESSKVLCKNKALFQTRK